MATKIRLQRHGRKGYAYYHIVVADVRAPRDGRFIERLGSYNPNTNPATVDLNFERSLYWMQTGAQPTDTVRNILSDEGVLLKKHLLGGVRKGAFDEAEADKKFETWRAEKQKNIEKNIDAIFAAKETERKNRLESEKEKNKAKAAEEAKKKALKAAEEAGATPPEAVEKTTGEAEEKDNSEAVQAAE
jgi:small subunit ribosomal protein S16